MKKIFTFLFTFLFINHISAQNSITANDMPKLNTSVSVQTLNMPSLNIGTASGTAQVWDFSNLQDGEPGNVNFIETAGLPGETNFTAATFARQGDFAALFGFTLPFPGGVQLPSSTAYYSTDAAGKVFVEGINTTLNFGIIDLGEQNLKGDDHLLYLTPATYNETFNSDTKYDIPFDFQGISAVIRITFAKKVITDAFGTLKLANNNHEVLRYKEDNEIRFQIGTLIFGQFIPIPSDLLPVPIPTDTTFTTQSYKFLTKGKNYPLVSLNMDPSGANVLTAEYLADTNTGPLSASYTFTVNCLNVIFTNTSANASTYSWSFGDGTTSENTNPVHSYTQAGTYTVKLSAIDANGVLQAIEKQITVTDCGTGITSNNTVTKVIVKYNKAFKNLYVQGLPQNSYRFKLYTLDGKQVMNKTIENKQLINVQNLIAAAYIYVIQPLNQPAITGKVIID